MLQTTPLVRSQQISLGAWVFAASCRTSPEGTTSSDYKIKHWKNEDVLRCFRLCSEASHLARITEKKRQKEELEHVLMSDLTCFTLTTPYYEHLSYSRQLSPSDYNTSTKDISLKQGKLPYNLKKRSGGKAYFPSIIVSTYNEFSFAAKGVSFLCEQYWGPQKIDSCITCRRNTVDELLGMPKFL